MKDPPSTDKHCMLQNNFHTGKSHWNSSIAIRLLRFLSNVNFNNQNEGLKSLSIEGGPFKKQLLKEIYGRTISFLKECQNSAMTF